MGRRKPSPSPWILARHRKHLEHLEARRKELEAQRDPIYEINLGDQLDQEPT